MNAHEDWNVFLNQEMNKTYFLDLNLFLENEINNNKIIYPQKEDWFNSLSISPEKINVIILGQDPYHGESQAHGFAFSVNKDIKIPPSLKNIYKEITNEFGIKMSSKNGNLMPWVSQGVMLINSVLTVEKGLPASHKNKGWETFTDEIIKNISNKYSNKVFLLWGSYAINKMKLIDEKKHLILTSNHPSPFSAYRGFFGNNHFKLTNKYLSENNKTTINWIIED